MWFVTLYAPTGNHVTRFKTISDRLGIICSWTLYSWMFSSESNHWYLPAICQQTHLHCKRMAAAVEVLLTWTNFARNQFDDAIQSVFRNQKWLQYTCTVLVLLIVQHGHTSTLWRSERIWMRSKRIELGWWHIKTFLGVRSSWLLQPHFLPQRSRCTLLPSLPHTALRRQGHGVQEVPFSNGFGSRSKPLGHRFCSFFRLDF